VEFPWHFVIHYRSKVFTLSRFWF